MLRVGQYVFKRAECEGEFEQVHSLNHRTFVDEIPQHEATATGLLIDKFHHKNAYFIVLRDECVVGMVSVHDEPPFSVADRLADPSVLARRCPRPLEVRLLAVEPSERKSNLFFGLIWTLYRYSQERGYSHLLISGVAERRELYHRLGFEDLGPAVGLGKASFIPMMLEIGRLPGKVERCKRLWEMHLERARPRVCLLPGPVTLSPAVREALAQAPLYHRGSEFIKRFMNVRQRLSALVGGREVAILNGSGTLANETIAAALSAHKTPVGKPRPRGILLTNGEFGDRLAAQAKRWGLEPRVLSWSWGETWSLDEIEDLLRREGEGNWIWGVHQESSTGVLNDLPGLAQLTVQHGCRLCVDCISSLGATAFNLSQVYLASGSTGKSLGALAGAALVFADRSVVDNVAWERVPSYFDLRAALLSQGPCYTFPSPTLAALEAALAEYATPVQAQARYAAYHALGVRVRQELRRLGLTPLASESLASPVITSFAPTDGQSSREFVERARRWGYAIGGESGYLAERRLVQIATMGAVTWEACAGLLDALENDFAKRGWRQDLKYQDSRLR